MEIYLIATQWIALALIASLVSVRLGVSITLIEIIAGVTAGNLWTVPTPEWVGFLASVGAVVLTLLAGVDIDTHILRKRLLETVSIGFFSFLFPFLGAWGWAYWIMGWELQASLLAGIALSTTSVAVVYAVMIETGLNRSDLGKVILAVCFVTDLGTVVALGAFFTHRDLSLLLFVGATGAVLVVLPRFTRWFFRRYGERVSEPEVKYLLIVLLGLGALAKLAGSEAVLPAYLAGLVLANTFKGREELAGRLRSITFSFLTPFYFIRAGLLISVSAVLSGFLLSSFFWQSRWEQNLGECCLLPESLATQRETACTQRFSCPQASPLAASLLCMGLIMV
jgi:Kef-type K+ transport system membrane component KefB